MSQNGKRKDSTGESKGQDKKPLLPNLPEGTVVYQSQIDYLTTLDKTAEVTVIGLEGSTLKPEAEYPVSVSNAITLIGKGFAKLKE